MKTDSVGVRFAYEHDVEWLVAQERHIGRDVVADKVAREEFLVAELAGEPIGWLRWSYFWDEIPFMNLLFIIEPLRGRAHGRVLVDEWECVMRARGHRRLLTSTLSDERAQHFYRRLGYRDAGALLLPGEALEILFMKELDR
ncbi:MAG TPA: GNAT family N-acetyltransferase [Pseudomonadales bacterium]|nr:GNAT family N-acetyltransferase [Pseudomonadales bacterium]